MNSLDFTKKYTGLSNAKVVNSLTEVTGINNQQFTAIQHGQHWHSRLSCWIKDGVRSFFSPLRKNATNTAWEQLGQDLSKDGAIDTNKKQLAQTKIKRWQKEGVPLRVLHVRQLLRQVDQDFSSRPPTSLRAELNNYRPDDGEKFSFKVSLSTRTESTKEVWKMEPLSNEERTVMESFAPFSRNRSPDPDFETPKLDEVAEEFTTTGGNWDLPSVGNAVDELLDKNGIGTTAEFKQAGDSEKALDNKAAAAGIVMTKFIDNAREKGTVGIKTEKFKSDFEKAFLEVISERKDWFERIDRSLTDADLDPAN